MKTRHVLVVAAAAALGPAAGCWVIVGFEDHYVVVPEADAGSDAAEEADAPEAVECHTCSEYVHKGAPSLCETSKPIATDLMTCGCSKCSANCQIGCSGGEVPAFVCYECMASECAEQLDACSIDD